MIKSFIHPARLSERIRVLRWAFPLAVVLLVVFYQFGPARWIEDRWGSQSHFVAEILFYGTLGPALAFLLLGFLKRWLEERETSDLQARVVAQAREQVKDSHLICDEALQTLFATSMLLNTIEHSYTDLSPKTRAQLKETEQALECTIQRLRTHLLNGNFQLTVKEKAGD